jgi:regulator of RNase E activity RraA
MNALTTDELEAIRQFDTCAVLNAIETFRLRLRNAGFAKPGLQWLFPTIPSVIGYAATLRVKSSNPPLSGSAFEDRTDWWRDMQNLPGPRVAVIQDIDESAGVGSVAGEVHAAIMQRLGCDGLITNGSVRDLRALEEMAFACSARSVSPSHAYAHPVDHNQPVEIFGLVVRPGDLLMADRNGVISIPEEIAADVAAVAGSLRRREQRIVDFCRSGHFSLDALREEVK